MGYIQAFKMAFKSVVSNKVRSFLTMLGVIIGVASVIAAVAFAQGSTKSITDRLSELGTEKITVIITTRNSNRDVTYDKVKKFFTENSDVIAAIAPEVSGNVTVKYGAVSWDTSLVGTMPDYLAIQKRELSSGRFLLETDNEYRQRVAVIGTTIVNELYGGKEPAGENIKINGNIFKIVGVLEELEDSSEDSKDDVIIIPLATAQRLMKQKRIKRYTVLATSPDFVNSAMDKLYDFLIKIYRKEKNFRIINAAQILSTLDSVTGVMMTVLGGIAAISLIVGGIGIMNIMLVSVTERTREIGIRKAIGAKRRNILTQFLIEALMVTGIGGIVGVILGCIAIYFIGKLGIVPAVYSLKWIIISFGISLAVGIIFGIFPARKAAKMNPIEALRYE